MSIEDREGNISISINADRSDDDFAVIDQDSPHIVQHNQSKCIYFAGGNDVNFKSISLEIYEL